MQSLAAKAVFPVPDAPYDNHIYNLALVWEKVIHSPQAEQSIKVSEQKF